MSLICRKRMIEYYRSNDSIKHVKLYNYAIELKHKILKSSDKFLLGIVDHPFKSKDISVKNYKNFLNHKNCMGVFSEDWLGDPHPKLTIMPIGFESNAIKSGKEKYLIEMSKTMKNVEDKPLRVLSNATLATYPTPKSKYRDDRQNLLDNCSDNPLIDFWKEKRSYQETFKIHNDYAFECCPEGNGIDTHRFYEAILLNTIPIVRKNPLTPMYEKHFPCLIVNEWSDINEELLKESLEENKDKFKDKSYCYMDYWKEYIENKIETMHLYRGYKEYRSRPIIELIE